MWVNKVQIQELGSQAKESKGVIVIKSSLRSREGTWKSGRYNQEQMFSETESYLAKCQGRLKPRNKRMSAMGPDSVLLGFTPDYLHVSISSPRYMDGATRDLSCCLQISEVSQRRGP